MDLLMPSWAHRHQVLLGLVTVWLMVLVTIATVSVFFHAPEISGMAAAALGTVYGVPVLVLGALKWRGEFIRGRTDDH